MRSNRLATKLVGGLLLATPCLAAPPFEFPAAAAEDPTVLAQALPGLAREVLAVYREDDRRTYLDNRFRLEIVAGRPAEALATLSALRAQGGDASPLAGAARVLYEVFAAARARESADGPPFEAALRRSFEETVGRLDDRTAALVLRALGVDLPSLQQSLQGALEPAKGQSALSLADALTLIRAYQTEQTFRSFAPLVPALMAEDDRRRSTRMS